MSVTLNKITLWGCDFGDHNICIPLRQLYTLTFFRLFFFFNTLSSTSWRTNVWTLLYRLNHFWKITPFHLPFFFPFFSIFNTSSSTPFPSSPPTSSLLWISRIRWGRPGRWPAAFLCEGVLVVPAHVEPHATPSLPQPVCAGWADAAQQKVCRGERKWEGRVQNMPLQRGGKSPELCALFSFPDLIWHSWLEFIITNILTLIFHFQATEEQVFAV